MKKIIIFLIVIRIFAFDYFTIKKADEYYQNKQFTLAAKEYLKLNSQKGFYNAANAYYKAGKYKEAEKLYNKITKPGMLFEKYYNLGNTYAHMHQYKKALDFYKKALKIKKDKDAEFNKKLIEKLLKKQQNKQNRKNKNSNNKKNSSNTDKKQKNSKKQNKQQQQKQQNQKQTQNKSQKQQKKQKKSEKNKQQKAYENKKPFYKKTQKKEFGKTKESNTSDIRMKFYEKHLKSLKFNTLLIPLKGNR